MGFVSSIAATTRSGSTMVGRAAAIQIVALAVILAGAAWQPVRAEDTATQHANNGASCARSTFRVLIDVGHTATSPGADSARGVPEYEFNLKLADVMAQSLHDAGFDETIRLLTSGAGQPHARRPVHRSPSRFGAG
jgi:N-acetylmuramoyl-L-alanine amidase